MTVNWDDPNPEEGHRPISKQIINPILRDGAFRAPQDEDFEGRVSKHARTAPLMLRSALQARVSKHAQNVLVREGLICAG